MSNAATGFWAATGAFLGAIAGAQAGKYATHARPRFSYTEDPKRPGGAEVEDAMVIGGGIGAVVGAFVAGTVAGAEEPKAATTATVTLPVAAAKSAGVGCYFP